MPILCPKRYFSPLAGTLHLLIAALLVPCAAQAQLASPASITGSRVTCSGGKAGAYSCRGIDLMSRLSEADYGAVLANDVWGWTDPETGIEYVLAGRSDAVAFIDISDPVNPIYVGFLPSNNGESSWWRDMKVHRDHMFVVVDGAGSNGMQVFDLTELRRYEGTPIHFSQTARYEGIGQAHNVAINEETGFAYIVGARRAPLGCGPGLHIVDISSPRTPTYAGCFNDPATGYGGSGYTHDTQCVIYRGPDSEYYGRELCFGSNETGLSIADVTDKTSPRKLGSAEHPNASYAHQGWLTEGHEYFIMNDELDERSHLDNVDRFLGTRMLIWDVKELDDPILYREYFGPTQTIDHNLYVRNDIVFAANYTSGLRMIDVRDPWQPKEIAFFDTHPEDDERSFSGAWTAYPFFASGNIVVSSHPHGIFVLSPTGLATATESDVALPEAFTLSAAYPNPFNPTTYLTLSLPEAAIVSVEAFDLMGRKVANVHSGPLTAGRHEFTFDASNLPSGSYLIRALGEGHFASQRVTLVK